MRNVCNIPDKMVSFRLSNKTGKGLSLKVLCLLSTTNVEWLFNFLIDQMISTVYVGTKHSFLSQIILWYLKNFWKMDTVKFNMFVYVAYKIIIPDN